MRVHLAVVKASATTAPIPVALSVPMPQMGSGESIAYGAYLFQLHQWLMQRLRRVFRALLQSFIEFPILILF